MKKKPPEKPTQSPLVSCKDAAEIVLEVEKYPMITKRTVRNKTKTIQDQCKAYWDNQDPRPGIKCELFEAGSRYTYKIEVNEVLRYKERERIQGRVSA